MILNRSHDLENVNLPLSQKPQGIERNGVNCRPMQGYCMQNYRFGIFRFAGFWLAKIHFTIFYRSRNFNFFKFILLRYFLESLRLKFSIFTSHDPQGHMTLQLIWEYKATLLCVVFVHRHKNRLINAKYTWRSLS